MKPVYSIRVSPVAHRRIHGSLDQVQEISFGIGEEQDPPAAPGRFDWFGERDTATPQFRGGGLDRGHSKSDVPPTSGPIVGGLRHGQLGRIQLEHRPTRQPDKYGGWVLAVLPNLVPIQNSNIPIGQRPRIASRQAQMFDRKRKSVHQVLPSDSADQAEKIVEVFLSGPNDHFFDHDSRRKIEAKDRTIGNIFRLHHAGARTGIGDDGALVQ